MSVGDYTKPAVIALGVAAATAFAFAAGYAIGRDPQLLRRTLRAASGGVERLLGAWAETREEIGDLWAEAREDARREADDSAFERAAANSDAQATAGVSAHRPAPAATGPKAEPKPSRSPKRAPRQRVSVRAEV